MISIELLIIIIIGLVNMGLIGLFDFNLIKICSSYLGNFSSIFEKILTLIILVSAYMFFSNKELYEPFISETIMPLPMANVTPNGSVSQNIQNLPPNVKVIYWATMVKNDFNEIAEDEATAYGVYNGGYVNQGVATTTKGGYVALKVIKPIAYKDKSGTIIKPHINYRYWITEKNMFSKIYKVYI